MHRTPRRPLFVRNVHPALAGEPARRIAIIGPSIDDLQITGVETKLDRVSRALLTANELVAIDRGAVRPASSVVAFSPRSTVIHGS